MRLVFFGTPEFAVPSLRALVGEGFNVVAVVTQPDKPLGRSRSTRVSPPVKTVALEEGLPVLQPEQPSTPEFIVEIQRYEPDLGIVVAYGHILKQALLDVPRSGMINVHASLLPALRGAAPIQHALLQGLDESGVSIMRMEAGMDTGPVILQAATPIAPDETGGELQTRLAELGALALIEALTVMELGHAGEEPQDHARATSAPKITRALAHISWEDSATRVARLVRAMDPTPGAWTTLDGREVKLFGPSEADWPPAGTACGQIIHVEPTLVVATSEGAVAFEEVQPAGKRRMATSSWVRGRGAALDQRFV